MNAPVMTLEEEEFWCAQADLLHAREASDEKARREEVMFLVAEWVLA